MPGDCPRLEKCPMFKKMQSNFAKEVFTMLYCQGDFEKCERKKLKDAGKEVSETLLPDGSTFS